VAEDDRTQDAARRYVNPVACFKANAFRKFHLM
jgi:hypothetical protein